MAQFFVTGTDFGVGKTIVAAWLSAILDADYWKPIVCGEKSGGDQDFIRSLGNLVETRIHDPIYDFELELLPDQAAAEERKTIEIAKCKLPKFQKSLVVEGIGSAMVPLNKRETSIDLMAALELPTIVVASSESWDVPNLLMTLEVLEKRDIPVAGIVMNGPYAPTNIKTVEAFAKSPIIAHIPVLGEISAKVLKTIPINIKALGQKLAA